MKFLWNSRQHFALNFPHSSPVSMPVIYPSASSPWKQFIDVPDLNLEQTGLLVLVYVDIDGEMCVDVSHLVLETLGDTNDQVVDESADCPEGSDILAGTVVKLDVDDILLWVREVDGQMVEVLSELACNSIPPSALLSYTPISNLRLFHTSWSFDGDKSRLDGDLDCCANSSAIVLSFS